MNPLNPREKRIVAIGILVAVIAVAWVGIISPLVQGFLNRAAERHEILNIYARNQRVLEGIPVWRAQADAQKKSAAQYAVLAQSQVLAAQALKTRINKLVADEGGSLQNIGDVQNDVPQGWVRVRADLQLTDMQLYKCLTRLDSEAPYVVIEYVSVAADRAFQTGHLEPMAVRIEIAAPFVQSS
ncbi:MAG TPA: type II secretion system protein GspM [Rhizomicrobium sp.]|jgi:type II secretory pathway component PulM|nr:type II secretion system protein GspM [Rhizomicrobium sp.]